MYQAASQFMQPFSYNTPERPTTEHLVSRVQSDHHGTREANCRSALHPRRVTITIITTRLATANRSRASAVVIDRAKIFLTSSMISMQNLVVVSHTVCAHVGPFFLGGGAVPLGIGGVADPVVIMLQALV